MVQEAVVDPGPATVQDNPQATNESAKGPAVQDNQGELILGKFKSKDDVVDAYKNAEKKLTELSEYKRRYEEMVQQQQYQQRIAQQAPAAQHAAEEDYRTEEEKAIAKMHQELEQLKQKDIIRDMLTIEQNFFSDSKNADVNNAFAKVAMKGAITTLQQTKPYLRYDQILQEAAETVREGLTQIVGNRVKETTETRRSIQDQQTLGGDPHRQQSAPVRTDSETTRDTIAARKAEMMRVRGG